MVPTVFQVFDKIDPLSVVRYIIAKFTGRKLGRSRCHICVNSNAPKAHSHAFVN